MTEYWFGPGSRNHDLPLYSRSSTDCAYPAAVKAVELQDITGVVLFHLPKTVTCIKYLDFIILQKQPN